MKKTTKTLLSLTLLLAPAGLQAERPRIYAITGARIVTAPGQVVENGTIVLRDGLIEAVGSGVRAPADAQLIEAEEGWTVYPAFIDAATHLGVPEPEQRGGGGGGPGGFLAALSRPREDPPGAPHELPKVRPEKAVVEELKWDATAAERHRKLGFGVAQSLPRSGIFRGHTAVVSLGGGDVRGLILAGRLAQAVALEGGGFVSREYPTSKIGAMAAFRQALLDAQRQAVWRQRHASSPLGLERPAFRSSDDALLDLLGRRTPVLFVAQSELDHDRFGQLSREFDLAGMVLARGCHEEEVRLRSSGLPVLLPLKFPDKPEVDDEEKLANTSLEDLREYVRAPALPAALEAAGVRFALTGDPGGSNGKFHENLARVVEAGLSAEQALAALTVTPAELLGIAGSVGTLEPGKVANLLVVDGELFTEKPELRYVFVDGRDYEMEKKEQKGDPDAVVDPRGVWSIRSRVMGRMNESTWTITGSPGAYQGFVEGQQGRRDFDSVQLEGNALTVRIPSPAGAVEITVVIEGDTLSGESSFDTPRGSMTIRVEGTRTSGPEEGAR